MNRHEEIERSIKRDSAQEEQDQDSCLLKATLRGPETFFIISCSVYIYILQCYVKLGIFCM